MSYLTVSFDKSFNRRNFRCEQKSLEAYLKFQVSQDIRKKLCVCFVLLNDNQKDVVGYYTLSNGSISHSDVPQNLRKKYPKSYDYIPVTLLGRLALDDSHRNKGLGSRLLIDALKRSYYASVTSIGSVAIVADSIDEHAQAFYEYFGFVKLPDSGKMFLDMNTVKRLEL